MAHANLYPGVHVYYGLGQFIPLRPNYKLSGLFGTVRPGTAYRCNRPEYTPGRTIPWVKAA